MFVQETSTDVFVEIPLNTPAINTNQNGIGPARWPAQILSTWSSEDLATLGIYTAVPFVVGVGYRTVGDPSYERVGDEIHQIYEVEPIPIPVPTSITRRQLILALHGLDFISNNEAIAAAQTGAVPAFISASFDALSEPGKTAAYVSWASMSECPRSDPLLAQLATALSLTEEQLDDWFRWAATI